jgi:alcohol dehydrogenase class IV
MLGSLLIWKMISREDKIAQWRASMSTKKKKDTEKTKPELISELRNLRRKIKTAKKLDDEAHGPDGRRLPQSDTP